MITLAEIDWKMKFKNTYSYKQQKPEMLVKSIDEKPLNQLEYTLNKTGS